MNRAVRHGRPGLFGPGLLAGLHLHRHLHAGRHESHGIDRDKSFGAFIGNNHRAVGAGGKLKCSKGNEEVIDRRRLGLIDQHRARRVGGVDGDGHVLRAVAARHVGELHFVAPGLWQVRHEAGGLFTFAGVAVLQIVFIDEVRGIGGLLPRPHELRHGVIEDDAAQLG